MEVEEETAETIRALTAAVEAITTNVHQINQTMERILVGKEVVDDLHALIEQHKQMVARRRAAVTIEKVEQLG